MRILLSICLGMCALAACLPALTNHFGQKSPVSIVGRDNPASTSAQSRTSSTRIETDRSRHAASNVGWNEIAIPKGSGGHFIVDVVVNGTSITFLVDSGASHVVLASQDARRVGLGGNLRYDLRYQTANGVVRAAPVTLRDMRIGQMTMRSIPASINEGQMDISLLGMSFLSKLHGFEYDGDRLILRW